MRLKEKMFEIKEKLSSLGLLVSLPNMNEVGEYSVMSESEQYAFKSKMIKDHLEKIRQSDAILVVNDKLKDVDSYIGANSFLEIGFAFSLDKKIFLLNNLPEQSNKVEIGGMLPVCLKGNLEEILLSLA